MSVTSGVPAALRKITDDPLFRPFLSGLFDAQHFVRNIIKEGKSEECFQKIVESIESINDEIKQYISKHKDVLMSGMHDVAMLTERFNNLSDLSSTLQTNIQRLKKEVADSYNAVRVKTYELERIHTTWQVLTQLKQFVQAKSQLDDYLKNSDDKDARSLANAAKTISELEKLASIPSLQQIDLVRSHTHTIQNIGANLRALARKKLVEATEQKNQMLIGNYLQVFFNFSSLSEVLVSVVDEVVKDTLEKTESLLDLSSLQAMYLDFLHKGGGGGGGAAVPLSSSKKTPSSSASLSSLSGGGGGSGGSEKAGAVGSGTMGGSGGGGSVSLTQLRIAMRETVHSWSSTLYESSVKIIVVQRVLAKKDTPQGGRLGETVSFPGVASGCAQGPLLTLFWQRLSLGLVDIFNSKLKLYPQVSVRLYPYLRRALRGEVGGGVEAYLAQERGGDFMMSSYYYAALMGGGGSAAGASGEDKDGFDGGSGGYGGGMFGSLSFDPAERILRGAGRGGLIGSHGSSAHSSAGQSASTHFSSTAASSSSSSKSVGADDSLPLLGGLRPLRDRYLQGAWERMTLPLSQMFPEVDGYIAALPSRRDLQTLFKGIAAEVVVALAEGDSALVQEVAREVSKAVKLTCSKLSSLILSPPPHSDTQKLLFSDKNPLIPLKTAFGEQNVSLFTLTCQLKDMVLSLPQTVKKGVSEGGGAGGAGGWGEEVEASWVDFGERVKEAGGEVDELSFQLLEGGVSLIVSHAVHVLTGAGQGGALGTTPLPPLAPQPTPSKPAMFSGLDTPLPSPSPLIPPDCSPAMQTLLRQLPALIATYLPSSNSTTTPAPPSPLIAAAKESLSVRIFQAYVTCAALTRPVTESSRLRCAADCGALEGVVSTCLSPVDQLNHCPVLKEFRAFRRLLFQDLSPPATASATAATPATPSPSPSSVTVPSPPNIPFLCSQQPLQPLRPSTLLHYLVCCGPPHLPLPFEGTAGVTHLDYVERLLRGKAGESGRVLQITADGRYVPTSLVSARALYITPPVSWKTVSPEAQVWEGMQPCLDLLMQRITVATKIEQGGLRGWYEGVVEAGSHFFK